MNTSRNIRTILILLALFMSSAVNAFADDIIADDIVIDDGIEHGTVVFKEVDNETRTVTLTVTPDAGYYIQKIDIIVQKLVDPSKAMAPRRVPGIASELEVSGPEESAVATDYSFVLPAGYDGALVTASFTEQVAASAVVTANTLMYNQTAQPLVTIGQVTGSAFDEGTVLVAGTPLAGYYTFSGDIYQPCTEESLADGTVTYYKPMVKFSFTIDGTYTAGIPTRTDAGTYTLYYKVEPDAAHIESSGSVEVTIVPATLTSMKLAQTAQNYTGNALTFTVSEVKAGSLTVPTPSDPVPGYTVTDNIQTAIGAYTLTVTGTGNYTGTLTADYWIVDGTVYKLIEATTLASEITDMNGNYVLVCDIDASILANLYGADFTGTFDGGYHTITGLSGHGLFNTVNGGTVKNVRLQDINVTTGNANGDAGAICNVATGAARIYNCGVLTTDVVFDEHGWVQTINETSGGSHVSGTRYVGGLVGLLDGTARVINCYSHATITGGTERGGIVGYNNYASKTGDIRTMVMNCMFYGDILTATGAIVAPVYGGEEISNESTSQLNNYNYFVYEAPFSVNNYTGHTTINKYNRALAAEERFLVRFEFYRHLLNSTRELAAWYVFGDPTKGKGSTSEENQMAKWVLDKTIAPYPILMPQGTYPSVVNYDPEFTYDDQRHRIHRNTITERARGKYLGKTLTVTIGGTGTGAPTGASITKGSLSLPRIDKDSLNYNFNYDKVQLPYYNEVGTRNYTGNKVVTGWKITSITAVTDDPYTAANYTGDNYDYPYYNFADRKSSNKDLYSVSGRVFSQGAYFDVPDGVTSITIVPYWGNAAYLSDATYDCSYSAGSNTYEITGVTDFGTRYINGTKYSINGDRQYVYTSFANALAKLDTLGRKSSSSVYDNAVVLVATIRAPKYNGGVKKEDLKSENLRALEKGICNLEAHIENLQRYGVPIVVAMNHFESDTEAEIAFVRSFCEKKGVPAAFSDVFAKGSEGGVELAEKVAAACDASSDFHVLYPDDMPIKEKIETVASKIYGAAGVVYEKAAADSLNQIYKAVPGADMLPVCMAKTQYSLSDDQNLLGRPTGYELTVRDIKLSAGAGFIVVLTGAIMTMPGLGKTPAAWGIDVDDSGEITGLS